MGATSDVPMLVCAGLSKSRAPTPQATPRKVGVALVSGGAGQAVGVPMLLCGPACAIIALTEVALQGARSAPNADGAIELRP